MRFLSNKHKKSINNKLAAALTTSLLIGSCTSVWAADYTNGLTGKEADKNFFAKWYFRNSR